MLASKWRPMQAGDLPQVCAIATHVHIQYPEDDAVFANRLDLYPQGCQVLDVANIVSAYVISHPWDFARPPGLNTLLRRIPDGATTYYIHDIALMPAARRSGAAPQVIGQLASLAASAGFATLSLVAVNGSVTFWERQGFRVLQAGLPDDKLRSYDDAARYMVRDIGPQKPEDIRPAH